LSKTVLKVENLSKQYRLGEVGTGTISHDLNRWWHKMRGKDDPYLKIGETNDRTQKGKSDYVWALKDINFEVKQGEVLGIIGKNGAGKSTLLKILSKVTGPTTGRIKAKGRIASLLEVGTGFHPEMTGRENIYMNGTIMGMTRHEITKKLDEIVDFAGVTKYLDTPVKRYSSGMMVRLGFAVAAHLEPEILIVDEVLAVGDAEFQEKAIGRMKDISKRRTILFVSHDMGAIEAICSRAILLNNGKAELSGDPKFIINNYLNNFENIISSSWVKKNSEFDNPYFSPSLFTLVNSDGSELASENVRVNESFGIRIEGITKQLDSLLTIGFALYDESNKLLFWSYHTDEKKDKWIELKKGSNSILCIFPPFLLNVGRYRISMNVSLFFKEWILEANKNSPYFYINVTEGFTGSPYWGRARPGILAPNFRYTIEN